MFKVEGLKFDLIERGEDVAELLDHVEQGKT